MTYRVAPLLKTFAFNLLIVTLFDIVTRGGIYGELSQELGKRGERYIFRKVSQSYQLVGTAVPSSSRD